MNLFKSLMLVAATAVITIPAVASADDGGHHDGGRDVYHRAYGDHGGDRGDGWRGDRFRDGWHPVAYRRSDWAYFHRPDWARGWNRDRWDHHGHDRDRYERRW